MLAFITRKLRAYVVRVEAGILFSEHGHELQDKYAVLADQVERLCNDPGADLDLHQLRRAHNEVLQARGQLSAASTLLCAAHENPDPMTWREVKRECLRRFCAARCALGAAETALERCRVFKVREAA